MNRRADEQARIREVLIALGGSPEALDRANESANEPSDLGSRIERYTRLVRPTNTPTRLIVAPEAPAPAVTETPAKELVSPAPAAVPAPTPVPGPKRQPVLQPAARNGTAATGTAAPTDPVAAEVAPRPQKSSARTGRGRRLGLALVIGIVAIAGVAMTVGHLHQGHAAQTDGATSVVGAGPVQARAAFSTPRAYAVAMTRLSLASGSTEIDGKPACTAKSTWEHWSCQARGRPTLGTHVGQRLTYRCSPSSEPQQPLVLLINCRPEKLSGLTS